MWIIQEATAIRPRSTHLLCGEVEVLLTHAFGCNIAAKTVERRQLWGNTPKPSMRNYWLQRMKSIQSKRQGEVMIPLVDVLEHFRGFLATDPRDIVYAALNIANDVGKGELQPEYRASVATVYKALAVHCLRNTVEPLKILSYCGTRFQTLDFQAGWCLGYLPGNIDIHVPF